jgi:predicted small secreted protein
MRAALLALGLFGLLAACNTVQGLGQDVQEGGETITDTAEDVEQDL